MKNYFATLFLALSLASATHAQHKIVIKNKSPHARKEIVSIPYSSFSKYFKVDSVFTIVNETDGSQIIHQLERLGQATPKNILLQVSVPSNGQVSLSVKPQKAQPFKNNTYARYVPERKDDFAWENDVVAFRAYGKALEGSSEDAQGFDFWAKRTTDLIIDEWYKTGDYHADHGKGLDYYAVGQTLGVGDIALFLNQKIQYTKHYRQFQVLDNGPLRSTFKLIFEPQVIAGQNITLSKTISLDAGNQHNKIQVDLVNTDNSTTPIVIGIARRAEQQPAFLFADNSLSYWEPTLEDKGTTGTAVLLGKNKATKLDTSVPTQFLLHATIKNKIPFIYYTAAAWDRAGQITTAQNWFEFIKVLNQNIQNPLVVSLK
ncbi:DUF4861 family protein [Sphingobacterium sp. SYP-B4668]|uniref:DUF4861 family protein n=1 Tax=Sphingobacterium sp. SYP-B4668 TaxID=2996035 RepID=UPI0022DE786B|nr:DUF4861 family protein [Sphingobacterium sp. SYP-B4668]